MDLDPEKPIVNVTSTRTLDIKYQNLIPNFKLVKFVTKKKYYNIKPELTHLEYSNGEKLYYILYNGTHHQTKHFQKMVVIFFSESFPIESETFLNIYIFIA